MINLLFICSGNICRSPIAEGIAPKIAAELGLSVQALSAGTLGIRERPADPHSVSVCKEVKVDISSHKSQEITNELVNWATYILVMERRHASHVREHFPFAEDKILELGMFGSVTHIPDPIGSWKFRFRGTRNQIDKCLRGFYKQLPRN